MARIERNGFFGHTDRYPNLSRDWEDIDCSNKNCVNNNFITEKCIVSSLAKIGDDGRCKGFKPREAEITTKKRTATSDLELE